MSNICIFGDSITFGAWDSEKGGWVNRLRLQLESKEDYPFVYNLGIPGDTTSELLKRFAVEAKARQPDILVFSIGVNDSIYVKSKDKQLILPNQFQNNLQKLVDKA